MKKIIPFIALIMIGCIDNKGHIPVQDCKVAIFTKSLNSPKFIWANDMLTISSGTKSDYFNAPNGTDIANNAPLLLKEIDNTKPFTFRAKVRPEFAGTYDAGAIYLFCNESLWQKFAFEMDEHGLTRLVTVRTKGTSDDNNHDAITQEEVYMKISSDSKTVGFYYSLEGQQWQLVRLYRNDYPDSIYIALSSQSPVGDGIKTQFTKIELTENNIDNFRLGL